MKSLFILSFCFLFVGCIPSVVIDSTVYSADYNLTLSKVERPEKAKERFGKQAIDSLNTEKYQFSFEDELVKVLWVINSRNIAFSLQNKTDNSIRILWDEGAFIDEFGSSHRIIHSGVKYTDRNQTQSPSIIARQAYIEDIVLPSNYVEWNNVINQWIEKPLLPDFDIHSNYSVGKYSSFEEFERTAKSKVDKTIQVLLPLQIENVVNDYIFTFEVSSVTVTQKSERNTY